MRWVHIYTGIVFFLLILTACTREDETNGLAGSGNIRILPMSVSTSAHLRLIVSEASTGKVVENQCPVTADPITGKYNVHIHPGRYNFYLLGNEPERLTPVLDNITTQAELNTLYIRAEEIPAVEVPAGSSENSNIPLFGMASVLLRSSPTLSGKAEASHDDGITWNETLDISVDRLASKFTLSMYRFTPDPNDRLTIRNIEIVNIPRYGYVLGKTYDGADYETRTVWSDPSGQEVAQAVQFTFFYDLIVPEYIPVNKDAAMTIRIEAIFNSQNVVYSIPLREKLDVEDYSLRRNYNYYVLAFVRTGGEFVYRPEVDYRVADWTDVVDNTGFYDDSSVRYQANWAAGTNVNIADRKVYMDSDEAVEYRFRLNLPENATWAATITNPIDFMFDETDGAVSYGTAAPGVEYKIRIKARKENSQVNAKTEFFITVNNGSGNVELNLPTGQVGAGDRYTIIQNLN